MSGTQSKLQAQCVSRTCDEHQQEELDMYCYDCAKPVCIDCVQGNHRDHKWDKLKRAAQQIRTELSSVRSRSDKYTEILQANLYLISNLEVKNKETFDKCKSRIQLQGKAIISTVEKEVNAMIEKLESSAAVKSKALQEENNSTEMRIKEIQETAATIEEHSSILGNHDLFNLRNTYENFLKKFDNACKPLEEPRFLDASDFVAGTLDVGILRSMIGSVSQLKMPDKDDDHVTSMSLSLTQIKNFTHGKDIILSVFPIDREKAWVHSDVSQKNELVDVRGQILHTRSLQNSYCACFYVEENGDQIFTFSRGQKIQSISPDGKLSTLINTAPLYPWGLTKTKEGDIFVTMTESSKIDYSPPKKSKRLVQRMSLGGKVSKTYQHDSKMSRLFTWPFRVVQNHNSDICVVDQTSADTGQLIVLHENGEVNFVYSKQHSTKYLHITDVCCDSLCNIIVADFSHDLIHLLSPGGKFLKYLVTKTDIFSPYCLALHDNILWVGCAADEDQLYVYKMGTQL